MIETGENCRSTSLDSEEGMTSTAQVRETALDNAQIAHLLLQTPLEKRFSMWWEQGEVAF